MRHLLQNNEKRQVQRPASFCRKNLSLASCSSAELASVSIQLCKNQFNKLYLQLVKKDSHLPIKHNKNATYFFVNQLTKSYLLNKTDERLLN